MEKYHGVTAEGIVESALDKVHLIEDMGYDNLVISIKTSDVLMCIKAHELIAQKTLIEKVIKEEEESFLRTLETGIRLLDKKMEETKAAGKNVISGVDAFTLYDTYGFPLDLTELILRENGMEANIDEFNVEMQKQKDRARNAAAIETGDWVVLKEGGCNFVGYDLFECDAEILRYRQIKQKNKVLYQIVLDQTPFYLSLIHISEPTRPY